MGDIFILIFKRITIFNSILMIIHCLFPVSYTHLTLPTKLEV